VPPRPLDDRFLSPGRGDMRRTGLRAALLNGLLALSLASLPGERSPYPETVALDAPGDLRAAYDVAAYRLDLDLDTEHRRLRGQVTMEATALWDGLRTIELDLHERMRLTSTALAGGSLEADSIHMGRELPFTRAGSHVRVAMRAPLGRGEKFAIVLVYEGEPGPENGVHWARTESGEPWVGTSCQLLGASVWWPCKDSFWHPEDKPDRLRVHITVPEGLYAVSNGRLVGRSPAGAGRETFHWRHDYPLETYSVTMNVAPYTVVERALTLEGVDHPVPFVQYVLPEHAERAAVAFAEVPRMLAVYGEAFGPFPFPESKFGLVETSFWGMEHSTAVAYGSSFPAWIEQHGGKDRYAPFNAYFDMVLIHESAHEWWGNAVSAKDWRDYWLHEGFATYAEGVYVEKTQGADRADAFFAEKRACVSKNGSLDQGEGRTSRDVYSPEVYCRGASVLHTLRQFVDDDEAWWRALRELNMELRYKNATPDDLRGALERETGKSWERFFDEWVRGSGYPVVKGRMRARPGDDPRAPFAIEVELQNDGTAATGFHFPLRLAFRDGGRERQATIDVGPGETRTSVACGAKPEELRIVRLKGMLGDFDIRVP
jgi:aminopeptidase N